MIWCVGTHPNVQKICQWKKSTINGCCICWLLIKNSFECKYHKTIITVATRIETLSLVNFDNEEKVRNHHYISESAAKTLNSTQLEISPSQFNLLVYYSGTKEEYFLLITWQRFWLLLEFTTKNFHKKLNENIKANETSSLKKCLGNASPDNRFIAMTSLIALLELKCRILLI